MSAGNWTCDQCGDHVESHVEADRMVYLEWLDLWVHDECAEAVKEEIVSHEAALLVERFD